LPCADAPYPLICRVYVSQGLQPRPALQQLLLPRQPQQQLGCRTDLLLLLLLQ
jgi:hypothetical protein